MARGKGQQTSGGTKKEKKESRQERRARLEAEAEAREQCIKILPYVGGVFLFLIVVFALWVRSVPPKVREASPEFKITPEMLQKQQVQQGFMDDVMAAADAADNAMPEIKLDSEVKTEEVVVDADADTAGGDEDVTEL